MFTTIQEGIQAIQKQVLSDTPPEHALYIPAQGKRTTYATEDAFDLHQVVSEFLKFESVDRHSRESGNPVTDIKDSKNQKTSVVDNGRKVLLLLGDTGSGKSLFCQDLITRLWQSYKPGNPIPLFISLARLHDPIENAIEETLTAYGFSAEQIATLKKEQQFIFVLDGYDEIHQFKNLYVTNKLNEWNARSIVTCRSQYLYYLSDTDKHFMPFHGEKRQPQLLQQFHVAPFSEKEIVAYVQQYERINSGNAVAATVIVSAVDSDAKAIVITDAKDEKSAVAKVEAPKPVLYQQLISIPGLQTLIITPFLLHLAVEALPDILVKYKEEGDQKDQKNIEQQKLTQAALYDVFIERWFKRQEQKLKTSKHIDEKAADAKPNFWKFCKELAVTMRAQNVTLINYTPEKISKFASATGQAKLNPWKTFFNNDEETELLRSACPIRKLGPNQYGFIHASLIEYFATRAMYEEIVVQQPSSQLAINITTVQNNNDGKDNKLSIDIKNQQTQLAQQGNLPPLPQSTLYQASITKNNNMIQFLADRVQESGIFKNKLFEAIEISKKDERYAVGAANAITALNCGEVNFNGMDFSNVRIPGAKLSGSLCDNTNFSNANLTDVNFQGAWLRGSNWRKANLTQLDFGELPFIKMQSNFQFIQYSPNGRWLAIECNTNAKDILICNAQTIQNINVLKGHSGIVRSVAWDSKSERLASGGDDKIVRVWEVSSGKELRMLQGHTDRVNSVAWDSQGERLASGSADKTVRVWEAASGKELRVLQGHTDKVNSVAWGSQSERLASGSNDGTVRVWEAASSKELHVLQAPYEASVNSVAWDSQGNRLASGSFREVQIWEAASGKELHMLQGHTNSVRSVAWDSKGERLASGSWDNTVRVWEAASGKELRVLQGHTDKVNSVAWNSQGERLASGGFDHALRIWEVSSGKELRVLKGHTDDVNSVAWDSQGNRLASGSSKEVQIWEAVSGKELYALHVDWVSSVAWDSQGKRLASGGSDHALRIWEVSSGKELRVLKGHTDNVNSVAWDSQGERLASGGNDKTVRVWEAFSGKELHALQGLSSVSSVAWDSKGERLASGSDDNTVRVWEASSGKELHMLQGHTQRVTSVAWDNHDKHLASGGWDNTVRVWEASSGKELRVLQGYGSVTSVAWDSKGQRLVGSSGQTVQVWELATGNTLACLQLPYNVTSCAWITTPRDQERLAVAFGQGVACFTLSINKNKLSAQVNWKLNAQLSWLAIRGATLFIHQLDMTGAIGLNARNYALLQQRGAVGKPARIEEMTSVADENNHSFLDAKIAPAIKNNSPVSDTKAAATSVQSAAIITGQKPIVRAASSSSAQLIIQHSPIFSTPVRDTKSSNAITLSDVKLDAKQSTAAAVEIDNTNADKPKNDSSCAPCCSLM